MLVMRTPVIVPVGTRPEGSLLVSSSEIRKGPHHSRVLDCQCDCGKFATVEVHKFLAGRTRSCGHLSGTDRDPNRPRQPSHYAQALLDIQGIICPWPLCNKPLVAPVSVDHDHRCCNQHNCCAYCPRGVVHHRCNTKITIIEEYREHLGLSPEVVEYLDTRRTSPLAHRSSWVYRSGRASRQERRILQVDGIFL
jgi:hypothetical protein